MYLSAVVGGQGVCPMFLTPCGESNIGNVWFLSLRRGICRRRRRSANSMIFIDNIFYQFKL